MVENLTHEHRSGKVRRRRIGEPSRVAADQSRRCTAAVYRLTTGTMRTGSLRVYDTRQGVAMLRRLRGLGTPAGVALADRADDASTGPASLMLTDPEGNVILIDQHVPKPAT